MDNPLAKYLGRKDLVKAIQSVEVVQGTARETGNTYYAINLKFINGYETRLFLNSDKLFGWLSAFDMIETQSRLDADTF